MRRTLKTPRADRRRTAAAQMQARQNEWLADVSDSAIADARRDEPERPLSELLTRHGLAYRRRPDHTVEVSRNRFCGHRPSPKT